MDHGLLESWEDPTAAAAAAAAAAARVELPAILHEPVAEDVVPTVRRLWTAWPALRMAHRAPPSLPRPRKLVHVEPTAALLLSIGEQRPLRSGVQDFVLQFEEHGPRHW